MTTRNDQYDPIRCTAVHRNIRWTFGVITSALVFIGGMIGVDLIRAAQAQTAVGILQARTEERDRALTEKLDDIGAQIQDLRRLMEDRRYGD